MGGCRFGSFSGTSFFEVGKLCHVIFFCYQNSNSLFRKENVSMVKIFPSILLSPISSPFTYFVDGNIFCSLWNYNFCQKSILRGIK